MLAARYADLARAALRPPSDPHSPDYRNFQRAPNRWWIAASSPQALLRAPAELWKKLDAARQRTWRRGLISSRRDLPGPDRLAAVRRHGGGGAGDDGGRNGTRCVIDNADFYVCTGTGTWSTGFMATACNLHRHYYNSYAIQPMPLDVLRAVGALNRDLAGALPDRLARARRYARSRSG